MASVDELSDAMVHATLEDGADADAERASKQAFLDAYLVWLRGGKTSGMESGMAEIVGRLKESMDRVDAAFASGELTRPLFPGLGEWLATVQMRLVRYERWAATGVDDFVLADKLVEIGRFGLGIEVTMRNISIHACGPEQRAGRKPLNRIQTRIVLWIGSMMNCLDDLFKLINTHRAVV